MANAYKKSDILGSIIFGAIGLFLMYMSYELDLGHPTAPGPGLFPFLAAFFLTIISLFLLVMALRGKTSGAYPFARLWKKPTITFMGTMLYVIAINICGFIIATVFLPMIVLRVLGSKNWWIDLIISFSLSIGSYILFDHLLEVPLPEGILFSKL